MEQPIEGYCGSGTGWPARKADTAAIKDEPVSGTSDLGRESSNCPR